MVSTPYKTTGSDPLMLTELYCEMDDFAKQNQNASIMGDDKNHVNNALTLFEPWPSQLTAPEVIVIFIMFHETKFRTLKNFYCDFVLKQWRHFFPNLVSYSRFVELCQKVVPLLNDYLQSKYGRCNGITYVDSTSLSVCHNKRAKRHRVFKGKAQHGKTSMGWFFGFKLHIAVNERGELLKVIFTSGDVSDITVLKELCENSWGTVYGDKGYISKKIADELQKDLEIKIVTRVRKNMKSKNYSAEEQYFLNRRGLIETVNDQLKNIYQIQHTRHRSAKNYAGNLLSGLIAYCWRKNKPSLDGTYAHLLEN